MVEQAKRMKKWWWKILSKYTTQVRFICESAIGLRNSTPNAYVVIAQARPLIFDFPYPIFDDNYKEGLETKILAHYYTREIGLETVGLWKFYLQRKMNEIMPYYNELYKSTLLEFDPMADTKFERSYNLKKDDKTNNSRDVGTDTSTDRNVSGNSSAKTDGSQNDNNWNKYSDTPQGGLQGIISGDYLTNATNATLVSSSTNNSNADYSDSTDEFVKTNTSDILVGSFKANDKYLEKLSGKSSGSSFSKLLEEYRATIINIDMQVIEALEPLFMQLW